MTGSTSINFKRSSITMGNFCNNNWGYYFNKFQKYFFVNIRRKSKEIARIITQEIVPEAVV